MSFIELAVYFLVGMALALVGVYYLGAGQDNIALYCSLGIALVVAVVLARAVWIGGTTQQELRKILDEIDRK